jgi:hypothetical protein
MEKGLYFGRQWFVVLEKFLMDRRGDKVCAGVEKAGTQVFPKFHEMRSSLRVSFRGSCLGWVWPMFPGT